MPPDIHTYLHTYNLYRQTDIHTSIQKSRNIEKKSEIYLEYLVKY